MYKTHTSLVYKGFERNVIKFTAKSNEGKLEFSQAEEK